MKKIVLSLGLLAFAATASFAQNTNAAAPAATAQDASAMKFKSEIHDFGTIKQNVPVEHTFTFTNTGKEPIILQRVQASCGCTTPSYSKDPILPGKTGEIKAAFNAAAAGAFNKSITVFSNLGTKVISIKGNVEAAPASSVPQNTSMIKNNN